MEKAVMVSVRVTEEERAAWIRAASPRGLSSWVREKLNAAAKETR